MGGAYYLTIGGNISLVSSGPATADFLLNYDVSATAGQIDMIDQLYTGSAQPAGAFLSIDEQCGMGTEILPATAICKVTI